MAGCGTLQLGGGGVVAWRPTGLPSTLSQAEAELTFLA